MKLLRVIVLLTIPVMTTVLEAQDKKAAPASGFDQADIAKAAALLAEKPTCFGRPIADRAAWDALAAASEGKGVIAAAERLLKTPMPEMTDEIFLIYSRTGSRTEGDRINNQRRGRIGTLDRGGVARKQGAVHS